MNLENAGNIKYDVIIIGAGPAGVAAAMHCLIHHHRVLVVTAESGSASATEEYIESVHPGLQVLLEQLGMGHVLTLAEKGRYTGIKIHAAIQYLGTDADGQWEGMHINKKIFTKTCLQTVIEKGAAVRFDTKVNDIIVHNERVKGVVTEGGESLYASFVVDCSGKKQIAGRRLNFHREYFSPPLYVWSGVESVLKQDVDDKHTAEFIPDENGWTWRAPLHLNAVSWTVLSTQKKSKQLSFDTKSEKYSNSIMHSANLQWRLLRPVCSEGLLLCGDAAGVLDPASGQGIFNAVLSGIQAADCIHNCLAAPSSEIFFLTAYDNWFTDYLEEKIHSLSAYYDKLGIVVF